MFLFSKTRRAHALKPRRMSSRRGSVLVIVLVFAAFLSAILAAFLDEATAKIKYYGLFYNRDDLRVKAYSVLETTLAVMNQIGEIENALWSPAQGWNNPVGYAGIDLGDEDLDVEVSFEDESGKLPLPSSADDLNLLIAAFEVLEIDFSDGQELAAALIDWQDSDDLNMINGYDGDDYDSETPEYRPPNRKLEDWGELRLIHGWREVFWDEDGLPTRKLARFKNIFSLYNEEKVNMNTANGDVLAVLEELSIFDAISLQDYLAGDDGIAGNADDRFFQEADPTYFPASEEGEESAGTFGVESGVLRVNVTVKRGVASFLLTAIVKWKGGANPGAGSEASNRARDPSRGEGATARGRDVGKALGYPFEILRITENLKEGAEEYVRQDPEES